jgi:hypothetical protein
MKKPIIVFAMTIIVFSLHSQPEQTRTEVFDSVFSNINSDITDKQKSKPYKPSFGVMAFPIMGGGPSFKFFLTNNFAFQTDLFWKVLFTKTREEVGISVAQKNFAFYGSFEVNPNFIYQKKIKTKNTNDLFWLMGAGTSLGITVNHGNRKFGANAILGLEFIRPSVAIQIDIRLGYGVLFNPSGRLRPPGMMFYTPAIPYDSPWHHFDWSVWLTHRWISKDKYRKQQ